MSDVEKTKNDSETLSNAERIAIDSKLMGAWMRKNWEERQEREAAEAALKENPEAPEAQDVEEGLSVMEEVMHIRNVQQYFADHFKGYGITDPLQSAPSREDVGVWLDDTNTYLSETIKAVQFMAKEEQTGEYDPQVFERGLELLKAEAAESQEHMKNGTGDFAKMSEDAREGYLEYHKGLIEDLETMAVSLEILDANGSLDKLYEPPANTHAPGMGADPGLDFKSTP